MNALSWFGSVAIVTGLFLVPRQPRNGFWCLLAGALSWLAVAYARGDWAMFALNAVTSVVDVKGVWETWPSKQR